MVLGVDSGFDVLVINWIYKTGTLALFGVNLSCVISHNSKKPKIAVQTKK